MRGYGKIVLLLVIVILMFTLTACLGGHDTEDVRAKIENELYQKYGEEFVVDRIGTRSSRGQKFYQARIYPKSIIGTNKEGDKYYYASASADKLSFGRLGGVGDSYPLVNLKLGIEDHLMPKAKNIFGKRVLIKIKAHFKRREPGNKTFWGYKVNSYQEAKKLIAEDPENRMIELELYIYIFDRIDNKAEKEKRRKEIFDFVQYLKEEDLFRYLEMGVIFIDERVLAPSYREYRREAFLSDTVKEVIDGENVYLPPMELRERMSKELQKEIDNMSEEELLANIRKIRKSELSYKGIGKWSAQYLSRIYSPKMIKEKYTSTYNKNPDIVRAFDRIDDVGLAPILNFIYE